MIATCFDCTCEQCQAGRTHGPHDQMLLETKPRQWDLPPIEECAPRNRQDRRRVAALARKIRRIE